MSDFGFREVEGSSIDDDKNNDDLRDDDCTLQTEVFGGYTAEQPLNDGTDDFVVQEYRQD